MENLIIRDAVPEDAEQILSVYAWYVTHTAITFEYEVPSLEEFTGRIVRTKEKYPYLVAEAEGRIVGYAYAGAFVGRAAYDWSCEMTIYLDHSIQKKGYGRVLYEEMEARLKAMGILNLYACIGYPEEEDAYLTKNSAEFHAHLGYRMVGEFRNCGYKFHRWYHMVWMEKIIGEHKKEQPPVSFSKSV